MLRKIPLGFALLFRYILTSDIGKYFSSFFDYCCCSCFYIYVYFCYWKLYLVVTAGPILESTGVHAFFQKKGKKGQNISKFVQKCTKFENILKKGCLMRVTITCMKQPEYVPCTVNSYVGNKVDLLLLIHRYFPRIIGHYRLLNYRACILKNNTSVYPKKIMFFTINFSHTES